MDRFKEYFIDGAIRKGGSWGGDVCRAEVSNTVHLWEDLVWFLIATTIWYAFGLSKYHEETKNSILADTNKTSRMCRFFEVSLSVVHFVLYSMVFYYKFNLGALINIFQPCPLIVLFQGLALYNDNVLGTMITLYILSSLVGALLGTVTPDIAGLDQPFELEAYYIQHYLILIVPVYLLCRRKFLALKHASYKSILVGYVILLTSHYGFYEAIDVAFNVNVEFMLCATAAMKDIFPLIPFPVNLLLQPSHRTALANLTFLAMWPLSYVYLNVARLIRSLFSEQRKNKMK